MKNNKIAMIMLLLYLTLFNHGKSDICSEALEIDLKLSCTYICLYGLNSTHDCFYYDNKCIASYKKCSYYDGQDEEICNSIITLNKWKKCIMKDGVCTEVPKSSCEEYDKNYEKCESFYDSTDAKICVLVNDKCQTHYRYCNNIEDVNEEKCLANIPKESNNKCIWENDECLEVPRSCKEFANKKNDNCLSLTTSDESKICINSLDNGINHCEEKYKTCELYNSKETNKNKEDCENIKIYSEDTKTFLDKTICKFSGNTCYAKELECEDFSSENECKNFIPEDTNKMCIFKDNSCKTQYKTCELYDSNEVSKTKEGCESIRIYSTDSKKFDNLHTCVFSDTKCLTTEKQCEHYFPECWNFIPSDPNKMCVNKGNKCEEQYKNCKLYNDNEINKNKNDCEAIKLYRYGIIQISSSFCVFENEKCVQKNKKCEEIIIEDECKEQELDDEDKECIFFYTNLKDHSGICKTVLKNCAAYDKIPNKTEKGCKDFRYYHYDGGDIKYTHKCYYEEGTCKEKKVEKCEDSDNDEDFCNHMIINYPKKCIFKNNICVETYGYCPNIEMTKEECESIKLNYEYQKCGLNENNKCDSMYKNCLEYKGDDMEYYCQYLETSDESKKCFYEKGACVEKYIQCNGYKGNVTSICESIIPYKNKYTSLETSHKCIMKNENNNLFCSMEAKECKEAITREQCLNEIIPPTDKKCIYINGQCKEEYIDCDAYSNSGSEIDKDICESIILSDKLVYKCIFNPDIKKCEKIQKDLDEINSINKTEICNNYIAFTGKKCEYINSECIELDKTCLEMNFESGLSDTICRNAKTSNANKKCRLKKDYLGCEEKDKNENDDDNDDPENNKKNNSRLMSEFKFNLAIIILCLLF